MILIINFFLCRYNEKNERMDQKKEEKSNDEKSIC